MAKVDIFYQELNYQTVAEAPVYSMSDPGSRVWAAGRWAVLATVLRGAQVPEAPTPSSLPPTHRSPSCSQP